MLDKLAFISAGLGITSIGSSIAAWYKERSGDDKSDAHAERSGIFIGLWPQTFIGLSLLLFKLKEMGYEREIQIKITEIEKQLKDLKK